MVPVCYISRSLSECERRYSQTEREALALVWACERLHPYIYGRQFDLLTDHKPLEAIYGPRFKPCARVERWVLRLQPYNLKYCGLFVTTSGEHSHESDEYVRFVAISATPRALTTREVEEASEKDPELIEVRRAIESVCLVQP
ncbi:hypothetical protein QQF64_012040 [Cirrhinus molitorella]|uniref:Reverse transcriptase RNase H-like domain-containing protein n=1 Tax=Cirrhinus molitorella TaxID=172907 RepID=A0ABR3LVY5_9TELE